MPFNHRLLVFVLIPLLAACSQLQQTGRAVADSNGVLQDGGERYLGNRKYRVRVVGSTLLFNGQAEQHFRHRAEQYTDSLGCKGWRLHEYKAGTENTLLGARQYAEGVVECL